MQPQYTSSDVSRFWSKVNRTDNPDECWEWTASCHIRGYGQVRWAGTCGKSHRVAWELTNGPIASGLSVCHHCDNRKCCNPAHLYLGTQASNMRDVAVRQRAKGKHPSREGESNNLAKLTEAQVIDIRQRYATGDVLIRTIAREFGVTPGAISNLIHGKTWSHVPLALTDKPSHSALALQGWRLRKLTPP